MKGWRRRRACQVITVQNAPETGSNHQFGRSMFIKKNIRASSAAANSPMPPKSISLTRTSGPAARGASLGTPMSTKTAVISASGRLTVKIECQPNRPVSRPPSTGPKAVVAMLARDSTPMAVRGGGVPRRSD